MRLLFNVMIVASAMAIGSLAGCETRVTTDNPPAIDVDVERPGRDIDVDVTPKPADVEVKVD